MLDATATLKYLADQAVKAAGPLLAPVDRGRDLARVKPDGTIEFIDADRFRDHQAFDLETVVNFADRFKEQEPAIWYSRNNVLCLIKDADRRDRVNFSLNFSPQYAKLEELETKGVFGQRELIYLLRTVFKDCLNLAGNLIDLLRKVTFNQTKDGSSEIGKGKSSIGQALRAEMTGAGTLPEYVTLDVPVFDCGSLAFVRAKVECVLEPDEQTQRFQFCPLPGQLELAATHAEQELCNRLFTLLDGVKVPLYYGSPTP